ncbi:hypothetical protein N0V82_007059 [Gnomoniopsis sp. IMI 355080]|nr:hypothetical protein N0V82_007059 [Gnomoniopsis sp. IMI 355080]
MSKYILATLATAGLVAGHGYVTNGTIGGVSYEFYQPYTDPYTSPTPERISRPIQGNGPVTNITVADIQCGGDYVDGIVGSSPAALHANATAGSDVTLYWTLWPDSHYGAVVTYMARCPDTGCQDYMPNSTSVWFKIDEIGMTEYGGGGSLDTWGDDNLMVNGNSGYTYTIPSCLADGYYLVRHEIIAVFVASSYPGAQLYPGCHQLKVTGGGSTTVSDGLVAFPGAYSPTDPGIVWDSSSTTYPVPGPSVFSCSGSSDASATSAATSASTSSSAAVQTSDAAASTLTTAVASSQVTSTSSASVEASSTAVAVAAASVSPTSSAAAAVSTSTCSKKRGLRRGKRAQV